MHFTQSSVLLCESVCVWSMCCETTVSANCGGKQPQTAHAQTHRLQSTIHLSHHPNFCFLSPPTKHTEGPQTQILPSIYSQPSSTIGSLLTIHLPSHDLPNTYSSSVFVRRSSAAHTVKLHFSKETTTLTDSYTLFISAGLETTLKTYYPSWYHLSLSSPPTQKQNLQPMPIFP